MDDVSNNGKSERKSDKLVVPKHGRGQIKEGGNHPRPGRPKDVLRGSMREILEKGLPHLEEFVTGDRDDARPSDQLKAIEIAGKFGLPKDPYDQTLIDELWEATEAALPDDLGVVERVREAWVPVLARKVLANT